MQNRYSVVTPMNSEVIKDVLDLKQKIEDEKKKDEPDNKELERLYLLQLYRGMEINSGFWGNNRFNRPY